MVQVGLERKSVLPWAKLERVTLERGASPAEVAKAKALLRTRWDHKKKRFNKSHKLKTHEAYLPKKARVTEVIVTEPMLMAGGAVLKALAPSLGVLGRRITHEIYIAMRFARL